MPDIFQRLEQLTANATEIDAFLFQVARERMKSPQASCWAIKYITRHHAQRYRAAKAKLLDAIEDVLNHHDPDRGDEFPSFDSESREAYDDFVGAFFSARELILRRDIPGALRALAEADHDNLRFLPEIVAEYYGNKQ